MYEYSESELLIAFIYTIYKETIYYVFKHHIDNTHIIYQKKQCSVWILPLHNQIILYTQYFQYQDITSTSCHVY